MHFLHVTIIPIGLISENPGGVDAGEALVTDPNVTMISFTGSTQAGRRVGDPASQQVALGPLISARQRDRVHAIVEDSVKQGAVLRAGGSFDRLFYQPTVLTGVKPGMRAFDEEVFGPVASVVSFSSEDELVSLANRTEYGLSLGIISASTSRALALAERIPTGLLHINDQTVADEPHIPFGGRGASGNGGRHGGPANWEEFTQWQRVTIKDSAPRYPF